MTTDPHALVIIIPWWAIIILILGIVGFLFFQKRLLSNHWEAVSAEIRFAELGTVTIQPNHDDIQLAHRAWVELATRKAGIPFDSDYDLIVEIYDSWYELFGHLRSLASECPATKIRTHPSTRELVTTLTQVLNRGLRPHLTKWHARFRRWYSAALNSAGQEETPQDVQRRYPHYAELVDDLTEVQRGLQRYMDLLRKLSMGE